jgi:hypothetical protein
MKSEISWTPVAMCKSRMLERSGIHGHGKDAQKPATLARTVFRSLRNSAFDEIEGEVK